MPRLPLSSRGSLLPFVAVLAAFAPLVSGCLGDSVDNLFDNGDGPGGATTTTTAVGGQGGTGGNAAGGMVNVGGGGTVNVGGGGTTSQGGGGTTTTDTGGGGTTTGTLDPEDCLDGVDNDDDGDVDCADADCQPGFECVAKLPNGWQGFYRVSQTSFPAAPPACDGGAAPEVFFAEPAGPAQCNGCSCGALQGASCSAPKLSCWSGSGSCSGDDTDWTPALADGQCHKPGDLLGFTGTLSCSITEPPQVAAKGACAPSGGDLTNKDPWKTEVGACSVPATGGGCGGAQVCVAKGSGAADEKLCIQKAGDAACPASSFQTVVHAFSGGNDTRSCTACTCGDGAATCNGGSYTAYDGNNCPNNDTKSTIDSNVCKNVSSLLDFGSWSFKATLPTAQGSCPADGGAPQGEIQTEGPVTFCCQ